MKIAEQLLKTTHYPEKVIRKALSLNYQSMWYYRKNKTTEREIAIENAVILCFDKNKSNYGRKRIKKQLEKDGLSLYEGKISRILSKNKRIAKSGRKTYRKKPKKTAEEIIRENLILGKDFSKVVVDEIWQSDITELSCREGKIYLCCIIDVCSRMIVGHSIKKNMKQEIVHSALNLAIGAKQDKSFETIFHSDRGSQYTARETQKQIEKNDMLISMSRPGKPNDNQFIETFWKTLKKEIDSLKNLSNERANQVILEFILDYNTKRLHSSIEYETPSSKYRSP